MTQARNRGPTTVSIWLDPVCPFSWNTARWLKGLAGERGLTIDWRLMSLAVLNEGRELPAPQQARMRDSRRIGRLMAAIGHKHGAEAMGFSYVKPLPFGKALFGCCGRCLGGRRRRGPGVV